MPNLKDMIAVSGSERVLVPRSVEVGAPDPNERIEVTIQVRAKPSSAEPLMTEELGSRLPKDRSYLSREEFAAVHGADPNDLAKVEAFTKKQSLDVVEANPARRSVVLAGTAANLSAAFGVDLKNYESPQGSYRGHVGQVHVPAELAPIVEGVFGFDTRRQARPASSRADEPTSPAQPLP